MQYDKFILNTLQIHNYIDYMTDELTIEINSENNIIHNRKRIDDFLEKSTHMVNDLYLKFLRAGD